MNPGRIAISLLLVITNFFAVAEQTAPGAVESIEPVSAEKPAAQSDALDRILEHYLIAVEDQEALAGPYDNGLSEIYYGLGKTYQNANLHENAIQAYQSSMQIQRVNSGIYSLEQVPMLRGIIKSQSAMGQWEDTSFNYGQLLWLHTKTFGDEDPRLLPVISEVRNWHLDTYYRLQNRNAVPHLLISHNMAESAVNLAAVSLGTSSMQLVDLLRTLALTNYYMASYLHQYENSYTDAYAMAQQSGTMPIKSEVRSVDSYKNGRKAYEQIIEILYNNPETSPMEQASAFAELGDWYLLFGQRNSAASAYKKAHTVLEDGNAHEAISTIFGRPILLPVIEQQRPKIDRAESPVTAEITITTGGSVRNINVIDSETLKDKTRRKAVRFLKAAKFRPQFIDKKPAESKIRITINVPDK